MRRLLAAAFLAAVGCGALAPAQAQTLQHLRVASWRLSVDTTTVAVGDTAHVVLDAKLNTPVAELDNVTLPQLFGFDVLGDERSCVTSGSHAECIERIAISPTRPGDLVVGPATLLAVDPVTGKTLNYRTNSVVIHATGEVAATPQPLVEQPPQTIDPLDSLANLFWKIVIAFAVAFATFVALAIILVRRLAVSGKPTPFVAPPPPPPGPPPVDPEIRFRALVDALEAEPTRERALALRAELRARVGAREKETLADLVARGAGDERTRILLAVIEHAAFAPDDLVPVAARDAVARLRAVPRS